MRTVTIEGDKLVVERQGKKEKLLPEATDIFFRKGVEGRILFRHDRTTGGSRRWLTAATTKTLSTARLSDRPRRRHLVNDLYHRRRLRAI
jgi:hypothetical protein